MILFVYTLKTINIIKQANFLQNYRYDYKIGNVFFYLNTRSVFVLQICRTEFMLTIRILITSLKMYCINEYFLENLPSCSPPSDPTWLRHRAGFLYFVSIFNNFSFREDVSVIHIIITDLIYGWISSIGIHKNIHFSDVNLKNIYIYIYIYI